MKKIYVVSIMVCLVTTSCFKDRSPVGIFIYENLTEYDVVLEKWKDNNCVSIDIPIDGSFSFRDVGGIAELPWPFDDDRLDSIRLVFNYERKVVYIRNLSSTQNKNIFNVDIYEKKKLGYYKYELSYPIDEYHVGISEPYEPEE